MFNTPCPCFCLFCVFSVCGGKADSFISDLPTQYFVLIESYFIYSYYLSINEISVFSAAVSFLPSDSDTK